MGTKVVPHTASSVSSGAGSAGPTPRAWTPYEDEEQGESSGPVRHLLRSALKNGGGWLQPARFADDDMERRFEAAYAKQGPLRFRIIFLLASIAHAADCGYGLVFSDRSTVADLGIRAACFAWVFAFFLISFFSFIRYRPRRCFGMLLGGVSVDFALFSARRAVGCYQSVDYPPSYELLAPAAAISILLFGRVPVRFSLPIIPPLALVSIAGDVGGAAGSPEAIRRRGLLIAGGMQGMLGCFVALVLSAAVRYEREARRSFLMTEEVERARGGAVSRRRAAADVLRNLLPDPVIEAVQRGEWGRVNRHHDSATVVFVSAEEAQGGEAFAKAFEGMQALVGALEGLAERHGIVKVKSMGSTFMGVSGVTFERDGSGHSSRRPGGTGRHHTEAAVAFALDAVDAARALAVSVKAGLYEGPIVSGVIGCRLAFDVFGDCANLAQRMCLHGEPGRVQLPAAARDVIRANATEGSPALAFTVPRVCHVKGRGPMDTCFVSRADGVEDRSSHPVGSEARLQDAEERPAGVRPGRRGSDPVRFDEADRDRTQPDRKSLPEPYIGGPTVEERSTGTRPNRSARRCSEPVRSATEQALGRRGLLETCIVLRTDESEDSTPLVGGLIDSLPYSNLPAGSSTHGSSTRGRRPSLQEPHFVLREGGVPGLQGCYSVERASPNPPELGDEEGEEGGYGKSQPAVQRSASASNSQRPLPSIGRRGSTGSVQGGGPSTPSSRRNSVSITSLAAPAYMPSPSLLMRLGRPTPSPLPGAPSPLFSGVLPGRAVARRPSEDAPNSGAPPRPPGPVKPPRASPSPRRPPVDRSWSASRFLTLSRPPPPEDDAPARPMSLPLPEPEAPATGRARSYVVSSPATTVRQSLDNNAGKASAQSTLGHARARSFFRLVRAAGSGLAANRPPSHQHAPASRTPLASARTPMLGKGPPGLRWWRLSFADPLAEGAYARSSAKGASSGLKTLALCFALHCAAFPAARHLASDLWAAEAERLAAEYVTRVAFFALFAAAIAAHAAMDPKFRKLRSAALHCAVAAVALASSHSFLRDVLMEHMWPEDLPPYSANSLDDADASFALVAILALGVLHPFRHAVAWGALVILSSCCSLLQSKRATDVAPLWLSLFAAAAGATGFFREVETRRSFELQSRARREAAAAAEAEADTRAMLDLCLPRTALRGLPLESAPAARRSVTEFESVAVIQSDIVGFSALSSRADPDRLVAALNSLFAGCDEIAERYGVQTLRTAGDAWVGAIGLDSPAGPEDVAAVLRAAEAISALFARARIPVRSEPRRDGPALGGGSARSKGSVLGGNEGSRREGSVHGGVAAEWTEAAVSSRVGVGVGRAAGAVVGSRMWTWELLGPAVADAGEMERRGVPNRVHVTKAVAELAGPTFAFDFERAPGPGSALLASLPPETLTLPPSPVAVTQV